MLRFLVFYVFFSAIASIPFLILMERQGVLIVLSSVLLFFLFLLFRARSLKKRLGARDLTYLEAPHLFQWIQEFSRRLKMAPPSLGIVEHRSVNSCVFGSFEKNWVLTRGTLERLPREQLKALVCLELSRMKASNLFCDTFLSELLRPLVIPLDKTRELKSFLLSMFFAPTIALFRFFLHKRLDPKDLDKKALRLSRSPEALIELYHQVCTDRDCVPAAREIAFLHLFIFPQEPLDFVGKALLKIRKYSDQILALKQEQRWVSL